MFSGSIASCSVQLRNNIPESKLWITTTHFFQKLLATQLIIFIKTKQKMRRKICPHGDENVKKKNYYRVCNKLERKKARIHTNIHIWYQISIMPVAITQCSQRLGGLIFELGLNFVIFLGMVIACNALHYILRPFSQPRIATDIIVSFPSHNQQFSNLHLL